MVKLPVEVGAATKNIENVARITGTDIPEGHHGEPMQAAGGVHNIELHEAVHVTKREVRTGVAAVDEAKGPFALLFLHFFQQLKEDVPVI